MWIGINTQKGKRVPDDEAFGYVMDEIRKDEDLFEEFIKGFNPRFYYGGLAEFKSFVNFAQDVVDWFYSGDWRYELE